MQIRVLGCLGAYPYNDEGTSAYLLESESYHLLVDAGSATLIQLENVLDPLALDAVILSHYHHDHTADLGVLQYYRQLFPCKNPVPVLPIYGHTEDQSKFEALNLINVSKAMPYNEAETLILGPFSITFMKTIHPVPCYAMRIVEERTGKVLVYTGDSGYLETFVDFAREADVFLADTYLFEGNEQHHAHFTSKEAGEIAKKAKVKKLYLTHLPQHGSLDLLKSQAQEAAGDKVFVALAEKNLLITI